MANKAVLTKMGKQRYKQDWRNNYYVISRYTQYRKVAVLPAKLHFVQGSKVNFIQAPLGFFGT